jgi:hypothetical protein
MTTEVGPAGYKIKLADLSDQANIQTALNQVVYGTTTAPSTIGGINATSLFGTLALKDTPIFTGLATFSNRITVITPANSPSGSQGGLTIRAHGSTGSNWFQMTDNAQANQWYAIGATSTNATYLAGATGASSHIFSGPIQVATSIDTATSTFSAFATPTTLTLGNSGTATHTTNINTGTTASGATKTINIGTGGATGSTTNISIGPASASLTSNINLNGKLKLQTQSLTTAVAGTIEYDGRVFYSTGNINRGLIPSTYYYTWTGSNYSFNTMATNQGYPSISLVAGTAYEVEALYMMAANTGVATATTVFGMTGTSVWTYDYYELAYGTSTSSMLGAQATLTTLYQTMSSATTIGGSSSSTRYYLIKYKGIVRCTTSGTFYLYVNGNVVTSNTIYPGSYIKITPIMQSAATKVGTWV